MLQLSGGLVRALSDCHGHARTLLTLETIGAATTAGALYECGECIDVLYHHLPPSAQGRLPTLSQWTALRSRNHDHKVEEADDDEAMAGGARAHQQARGVTTQLRRRRKPTHKRDVDRRVRMDAEVVSRKAEDSRTKLRQRLRAAGIDDTMSDAVVDVLRVDLKEVRQPLTAERLQALEYQAMEGMAADAKAVRVEPLAAIADENSTTVLFQCMATEMAQELRRRDSPWASRLSTEAVTIATALECVATMWGTAHALHVKQAAFEQRGVSAATAIEQWRHYSVVVLQCAEHMLALCRVLCRHVTTTSTDGTSIEGGNTEVRLRADTVDTNANIRARAYTDVAEAIFARAQRALHKTSWKRRMEPGALAAAVFGLRTEAARESAQDALRATISRTLVKSCLLPALAMTDIQDLAVAPANVTLKAARAVQAAVVQTRQQRTLLTPHDIIQHIIKEVQGEILQRQHAAEIVVHDVASGDAVRRAKKRVDEAAQVMTSNVLAPNSPTAVSLGEVIAFNGVRKLHRDAVEHLRVTTEGSWAQQAASTTRAEAQVLATTAFGLRYLPWEWTSDALFYFMHHSHPIASAFGVLLDGSWTVPDFIDVAHMGAAVSAAQVLVTTAMAKEGERMQAFVKSASRASTRTALTYLASAVLPTAAVAAVSLSALGMGLAQFFGVTLGSDAARSRMRRGATATVSAMPAPLQSLARRLAPSLTEDDTPTVSPTRIRNLMAWHKMTPVAHEHPWFADAPRLT